MFKKISLICALLLSPLSLSPQSYAASLQLSIEVPKLTVTEYHAPYTAIWLESVGESDKKFTKTLAVWYDMKKKNSEGEKWLKDLRQWWRRDGRDLQMPVDGVAGATKLAGTHQLNFTLGQAPLTELPKGSYTLFVEMVREVGGREVVKVPFAWPVEAATSLAANGTSEIGAVTLILNP